MVRWLKAGEFDLRIQWSPFFLEGFLEAYNHACLTILLKVLLLSLMKTVYFRNSILEYTLNKDARSCAR